MELVNLTHIKSLSLVQHFSTSRVAEDVRGLDAGLLTCLQRNEEDKEELSKGKDSYLYMLLVILTASIPLCARQPIAHKC